MQPHAGTPMQPHLLQMHATYYTKAVQGADLSRASTALAVPALTASQRAGPAAAETPALPSAWSSSHCRAPAPRLLLLLASAGAALQGTTHTVQ